MDSGVVVLGAGIAGISAAWHAKQYGVHAVVYEARARFGGLLDNFSIQGTLFDHGVHYSFTNSPYVRSLFDQTPYYTHFPEVYNYERGRWLKHPVQNNLFPLPPQEKVEAIKSFIDRPSFQSQTSSDKESFAPENYYDWLLHQYGTYITNRYPALYTKKYWTVDAAKLGTDWVGNRMNRPSLDEVLLGAFSEDTPSAYYVKEMRYPKQGGYRAFIEPMAMALDIRTNKRVISIDAARRIVSFTDGTQVEYESLLSSLPLPEIIKMMPDVPTDIKEAAQALWATSVALVSIGFNKPNAVSVPWFYIYDEDILAARAYAPHKKSDSNIIPGTSALQYEVYYSRYKPLPMSLDNLAAHMIDKTISMGLAARDEILFADVRVVPYANIVFDHGTTNRAQHVLSYLQNLGIHPIGRFGEWRYFWSDQSLLSGKKAADRLFAQLPSAPKL